MVKRYCKSCGIEMVMRHKIKYCSNKCQTNHRYNEWVILWKKGLYQGGIGLKAKNISGHIRIK